jgi:hypothetical protein
VGMEFSLWSVLDIMRAYDSICFVQRRSVSVREECYHCLYVDKLFPQGQVRSAAGEPMETAVISVIARDDGD